MSSKNIFTLFLISGALLFIQKSGLAQISQPAGHELLKPKAKTPYTTKDIYEVMPKQAKASPNIDKDDETRARVDKYRVFALDGQGNVITSEKSPVNGKIKNNGIKDIDVKRKAIEIKEPGKLKTEELEEVVEEK